MKFEITMRNVIEDCTHESVRCIFAGYEDYEELTNQTQALNRKQARRVIRGYVIEQQFENSCRTGKLPFTCEKKLNTSRGAEHIELSNSNFILTIRSVTYPKQLPPKTIYQDRIIESCQGDFFNKPTLALVEPASSSKTCLIITYGGKGNQPDFIYLGSPSLEGRGWKFLINLMELPCAVSMTESEDAIEIEQPVLKLKTEYLNKFSDKKHGEGKR